MRCRWWHPILVAAAVATACTSATPTAEPEVPTPSPTATVAAPTPTATPTPDPTPTPTPTPVPRDPLGLTSLTGVNLVVLAVGPDTYVALSPCGNRIEIRDGEPLFEVDVVLDPGHGGPIDTGAEGPNGVVESALNLDVAVATRAELEARGITVALTRTGAYAMPLVERARFADSLLAEIMVSIHHNAPVANPSTVPGTEVFVQTASPESQRLGGLLYTAVFEALAGFDGIDWTTGVDAGVLSVLNSRGTEAYGMMRNPVTPTALIELAYLANPSEAAVLASDAYLQVAAEALADAIEAYLRTDDVGEPYSSEPRVFDPSPAPGADVCEDPILGM